MNNYLRQILFATVATGIVFFAANYAVAKSDSTLAGEEVCIPAALEKDITACESGIKMGDGKPSSKVGTSTKERKVKKTKEELGPGLGADFVSNIIESSFTRKREARKLDILKKEIRLILRLAKQTSNDNPEKGEILKRLADAYKEFYDQINFMARGLDEKIFQAQNKGDKSRVKKLKVQQIKLDKKANQYREKSIKAYVEIRNNFPDYPGYDEILFAIAYEIDQMASEHVNKNKKASYRERARLFYQELIRNYPQSTYIPHAWMAFGEYYFHEAHDVERAMRAYEKVVEWGEKRNPNYIVAQYYQAWCLINMQEPKKAINQFNKVIQYAEGHPENKEAKVVARRARMEMVSPFSKIGNPAQAWEFFKRVGEKQDHSMLNKLAELYFDDGHWADAIIVFHQLEKLEIENYRNNNGDDLCHYQTMVTLAAISSQSKEKQVVELKRQMALSEKFASETKHDKVKIDKCNQDTIAMAWDEVTKWHVEAVGSDSAPGTKDDNTMNLCIELYDEILTRFPTLDQLKVDGFNPETKPTKYRVAYNKANLYYEMENWDKCAVSFDAVVDMDSKGEYTSDAAFAAVLCYNKVYVRERGKNEKTRKHALSTEDKSGGKKCDKSCKKCRKKECTGKKGRKKSACFKKCATSDKVVLKPRELTNLEQGIIKSYNRYICYVDKSEDMVTIKYRRARIYYEANMFKEAAVLFKDIAVKHSDEDIAVYAANLYLDCLNALGSMVEQPIPSCYDDLADIVDLFIDTDKKPGKDLMKDEAFATQIKALKVGVLRKKAEALNDRGRFKEAAEIYLVIYREYQGVYDDRGMCEVLFNTAVNLSAARLLMSAIKVREKMIELYPKCEHSKKAAYFIGENYHALQSFSQAADNYVSFASKYSGEEESPIALANAVMFYIGLGQPDKAFDTVKKFEKFYAKKRLAETATLVYGTGFIYVRAEEWESVRKWYSSYLKKYKRAKLVDEQVQALVHVADSYRLQKRSDTRKALKAYKKAVSTFEKGRKQVTENIRKANMLIAAAKAKYYIAEEKFKEFKDVKFPEFEGQKKTPKKISKWWAKEQGPEKIKAAEKWSKDRRRLARWGYYDEGKPVREQIKAVKKEERKETLDIQFNYWALHSLKPWMEKKIKLLAEGQKAFGDVATLHIPEWEMAAAARAGDMQLQFMKALYDSPLPPSFKGDQELIDIYRGEMDKKAEPYREGAVNAYAHCLKISTKVRWFNENSIRCEDELNKLEPRQYPIAEEIRITPKAELTVMDIPPAILALETETEKRERALTESADAIATAEK